MVRKINKLQPTLRNIPGKTLNRFTFVRTKSVAPRENFFFFLTNQLWYTGIKPREVPVHGGRMLYR